jgi:hypothetical protein
MSDESIEAGDDMVDVTKLSLRELDGMDDTERERAVRRAFDRAVRNDDAMSSQSVQPEFSDPAM